MVFDSNNSQLILNIDPHFNDLLTSGATDTDMKKYFDLDFNISVATEISPLITNLLQKNITVVICDLRSPQLHLDVMQLIKNNLEGYKGPDDDKGNLVLLQGYFSWYPLFWPTKSYVEAAGKSSSMPSAYFDAMKELRQRVSGAANDIANAFEADPITSIDTFLDQEQNVGILFSYPRVGEISKAATIDHQNQLGSSKT